MGPYRFDGFAHARDLVGSKVVEQDHLAGLKHRDNYLLDVGEEVVTVGASRDSHGSSDAVKREPHRQRDVFTRVERDGPVRADPLWSARVGARHPEVEAELVDKDQVFRPIFGDFTGEVSPQALDTFGVALRCVKRFFFGSGRAGQARVPAFAG